MTSVEGNDDKVNTDTVKSEIVTNFHPVPDSVLKNHELFVLKTTLSILNNPDLVLGDLDKLPNRLPELPSFTIKERLSDNNDSYVLGKGDLSGEAKIDKQGHLKGSRNYLFPTFSYSCPENNNSENLYVLVKDLIMALNLNDDEQHFLQKYSDLYPMDAPDNLLEYLKSKKALPKDVTSAKYTTARSAFLVFGAAILASGSRVIDDYWEQLSKEQGFQTQHRVYILSSKLIDMIHAIEPKFSHHVTTLDTNTTLESQSKSPSSIDGIRVNQNSSADPDPQFENPFLTVTEIPSTEVRREFLNHLANGNPTAIIAGQTIHGSIQLSNAYKIPKYHYKNSFASAQQNNALDTPIGTHTHPVESHNFGRGRKANYVPPEETDVLAQIPGWKFTQLPTTTNQELPTTFSSGGLPIYNKLKLPSRLKELTPNQIKDLERSHDVVQLNKVLGNVRKVRNSRWTKFWQYKAGVPVGLTEEQIPYYKSRYLQNVLDHVEVNIVPNDLKNVDEKHTVKRIPNPNFIGYSNISGFKPPFIDKP